MTPKAADAASILDFSEKSILREVTKDADAKHKKLYCINGGAQEGKFNFVKKFLHGIISGSTQEKNSSTRKIISTSKWLSNWFLTISFI